MKKNMMMRLASVLLVLTMLSTCVFGGAFAKYVSEDSAGDSARVAKWGVVIQTVGNLFGEAYSQNIIVAPTNGSTDVEVQSFDGYDTASFHDDSVVAPGTQNSDTGFGFTLEGKPEVASKTTVTMAAQRIFLRTKLVKWGVMVQVPDDMVTATTFDYINEGHGPTGAGQGGKLYVKSGDTYAPATSFDPNATYYTLEDGVDLSKVNMDYYYPLIFALGQFSASSDCSVDTLKALVDQIVTNFGSANISTGESTTTQPSVDNHQTYTRTIVSNVMAPNTDLADQFHLANQTISWLWQFQNNAATPTGMGPDNWNGCDTILGHLMAEKADPTQYGAHTDDGWTTLGDSDGDVVICTNANDTWSQPVEYQDYCLETSFNITIRCEQVDNVPA